MSTQSIPAARRLSARIARSRLLPSPALRPIPYLALPCRRLSPPCSIGVGAAGGVVALLAGIYFLYSVLAEEQGNSEMRRLRGLIYDGARAYLFTQYRWLTAWAAVM